MKNDRVSNSFLLIMKPFHKLKQWHPAVLHVPKLCTYTVSSECQWMSLHKHCILIWFEMFSFFFQCWGYFKKNKSVSLTEKYLHISNCLTVLAWFSSLSKFRIKDIVKPLNLKRFFFYVYIIYENKPNLFGMLIKICWHKQYRNLALRYFFYLYKFWGGLSSLALSKE